MMIGCHAMMFGVVLDDERSLVVTVTLELQMCHCGVVARALHRDLDQEVVQVADLMLIGGDADHALRGQV